MPSTMKVCRREKLRMVVHLMVLCAPLGILCLVPNNCPASLHVPAMTWDEAYPSPCLRALRELRAMLIVLHQLWKHLRHDALPKKIGFGYIHRRDVTRVDLGQFPWHLSSLDLHAAKARTARSTATTRMFLSTIRRNAVPVKTTMRTAEAA